MQSRPLQYSLAGLFMLLTGCSLWVGYVRFVGIWRFVLALGPPLVIAAVLNVAMSPDTWFFPPVRGAGPRREFEYPPPDAIRVLVSLVLGLVAWVPVLLILNWR